MIDCLEMIYPHSTPGCPESLRKSTVKWTHLNSKKETRVLNLAGPLAEHILFSFKFAGTLCNVALKTTKQQEKWFSTAIITYEIRKQVCNSKMAFLYENCLLYY